MNLKNRKILETILIIFILIIVIFIIVSILKPKSYEKTYMVGEYEIQETFDKEHNYYSFSLVLDDIIYNMSLQLKYINKKELIEDVRILDGSNFTCVLMMGEKIEEYPICYNGEIFVDYDLIDEPDKNFYVRDDIIVSNFEYEGIEMRNTFDKNYLVWNYKGYNFLSDKLQSKISFLENESYYNNLAYQIDEFVITPNYDESFSFTEMIVLDMKKGQSTTWKLGEEISYNSYYLGSKDGNVYLVDRKNKSEYAINPRKKKIERVDEDGTGKVWNSKWETVSMAKLVNDDFKFETTDVYNYSLNDKTLLLTVLDSKVLIKVSSKSVDKIISVKGDEVFYLVGDELYRYSFKYGEQLCLKYTELNFNNINSIFIY